MKSLNKIYKTTASKEKVNAALTDENIMTKWSGSAAKMETKAEGKFSLWENQIYGVNKKISQDQIVQDWFAEGWDKPSKVVFNIKTDGNKTIIELQHDNIPDESFDGINKGWDEYYMEPMIKYLEGR